MTTRTCPFLGLDSFAEADRPLFFGRDRERLSVASSARAARFSVLYGKSGVGKSSLLSAGVAPALRESGAGAVVLFHKWQGPDFLRSLKRATIEAVEFALVDAAERAGAPTAEIPELNESDSELPFDALLAKGTVMLGAPIFVLLDRFDQYLFSHSQPDEPFDAELARAIGRDDILASFVVSVRAESLASLQRFAGTIPNLFSNLVPLEPIDRTTAEGLVWSTLKHHNNELSPGTPPLMIEQAALKAVLDGVETGRLGARSVAKPAKAAPRGVEPGYLEMVLERLYRAEEGAGSRVIRLETLVRLGGVDQIVTGYVDAAAEQLADADRDLASRLLRHLVPPAGMKVSHRAADLARLAEVPTADAERVLCCLAVSTPRVLRAVCDSTGQMRYEILHELLAQLVLGWQQRHAVERELKAASAEADRERQRLINDRREADERAREEVVRERKRADDALAEAQRRASEAISHEKARAKAQLDDEKRRGRQELEREKRTAAEGLARARRSARARLLVILAVTVGLLSGASVLLVWFNAQAQNVRKDALARSTRADAERAVAEIRATEETKAALSARNDADRAKAEAERAKRDTALLQQRQAEEVATAQASLAKANERVGALQAGVAVAKAELARVRAQCAQRPEPLSSAPAPTAVTADDVPAELR